MHSEIKLCHSKKRERALKQLQSLLKSKSFNPEILDVSWYITPKPSPVGRLHPGSERGRMYTPELPFLWKPSKRKQKKINRHFPWSTGCFANTGSVRRILWDRRTIEPSDQRAALHCEPVNRSVSGSATDTLKSHYDNSWASYKEKRRVTVLLPLHL